MNVKKLLSAALAAVMLTALPTMGTGRIERADAAGAKSRVSVHDPSIVKANDGTYYVFGSHIDAAKSTDLQSWKLFSNGYATTNNVEFGNLSQNLAKAFAWAGEDLEDCAGGFAVWAPDVVYNPDYVNTDGSKGAYMMYFCTSSTYMRSVIAYAVSQKIEGPYTFVDTLIYSGFTENDSWATSTTKRVNRKYTSTNVDELIAAGQVTFNSAWFSGGNYNNGSFPNAIDPTIYYDTSGRMYMCYGSWSGGIFTLEIDKATGQCIHPKSGKTSDGRMIDSYFGTLISGGYKKSGEGPFIEYNPETGYYYLWVTYGGLFSDGGYNMRVFRSKDPMGPFTDPAGRQAVLGSNTNLDSVGLKVMGNHRFSSYKTAYMACGHNSVLCDDDGRWYLANHARFDDGSEYHEVRIHSMYFNEDGWPVVAPFEYSGDVMSPGGYSDSDIVGEYEYINHGNDTGKTIYSSTKIKLNADGSVSGAVTGTWTQDPGSSGAELNIGGQRYSGYFMAIQDETGTGTKHMAFTAVGSNNQTIWGAKTSPYSGSDRVPNADYTNHDSQAVYAPDTLGKSSLISKIGDTDLISGQTYFIINSNSDLLMEITSGLTDDGTNIQQWEMNKGPHHEWRLVAVDSEYCRITCASDETKCVTVDGNSAENGLNVILSTYTGADNQLWKIIDQGMTYGIVSKCSGATAGLDVYDWSTKNGGNVNQWEFWGGECQLWRIVPVRPEINDWHYNIRDPESGDFISSREKMVYIGFRDGWTSMPEQRSWHIEPLENGRYAIRTSAGDAMTIVEAASGGFLPIAEKYTGSEEQQFTLRCNKNGTYTIISAANDKLALTIGGSRGLDFVELGSEEAQQFILEPMTPDSVPVIGDVNKDGELSAADLVTLHRYLLGMDYLPDFSASDLNDDGTVDTFDLVRLRQLILEK